MSLVKVGTHYINTEMVQFTSEHQGVVLVHFASQTSIRLSAHEWEAVSRTMTAAPRERTPLIGQTPL